MRTLVVGTVIGAMLSLPATWMIMDWQAERAEAGTSFTAEQVIRDADFNVLGDGGYLVGIVRCVGRDCLDVGGVVFYDIVGTTLLPRDTFLCVDDLGWDCYRY